MSVNSLNVKALRAAITSGAVTGSFLPAVYVVEPVSHCNLQCVMCPNGKMTPTNWGDIDIQTFSKLMNAIQPYCEFLMLYWMGEPLLHPHICELLSIARAKIQGRIVVSSNMTVLPDEVADSLLENADVVLCCIDRWEKSAFERVRRGAVFEEVVGNTEKLINRKRSHQECKIIVKALDINSQSTEYEKFCEYWKAKGAIPMQAWLNDWAGSLSTLRNAAKVAIPRDVSERSACADLWFKMVVNWRADVQLCCFDWNYTHNLGALSNGSSTLEEIWHSDSLKRLREGHLARNWQTKAICKTCTTWGEIGEFEAYVDFTEESYFRVF